MEESQWLGFELAGPGWGGVCPGVGACPGRGVSGAGRSRAGRWGYEPGFNLRSPWVFRVEASA